MQLDALRTLIGNSRRGGVPRTLITIRNGVASILLIIEITIET